MEVRIAENIKQDYLEPFGITEEEVEDTVTKNDSKKELHYGDYHIILFLKKISKGYHLLVDGRRHDPEILIASAFKVFPHTIHGFDVSNPLIILQRFAENFGYNMVIGDQYNRFIYDATIRIPKVDDSGGNVNYVVKLQDFGSRPREKALGINLLG